MMKEKIRSMIKWVKAHRTHLALTGISVAAVVLLILGVKNSEELMNLKAQLLESIRDRNSGDVPQISNVSMDMYELIDVQPADIDSILTRAPHSVNPHIRNLPDGWKASDGKIATALANGFDLGEGQTWVDKYRTGV